MKAEIRYDELTEYIKSHFGQNVSFSYVDMRTLTVTANVRVLVMPVSVPLTVHVESVKNSDITMTYSGNFGVDAIITSILKFLSNKVTEISKIIDYDGHHTIKVHLSEVEQLKSAFEVVTIKDIWFMRDCVVADLSLK